jgi:group I intron endonuclease
MGFIYRISYKNKSYIGQTRRPYEERWKQHKNNVNNLSINRPLVDAMRVIGVENFVFEVLLECNDSLLNLYEQKLIKQYDSLHPHGYNYTTGGECNFDRPEELCRKIGEGVKRYFEDPEARERNKIAQKKARENPELREKDRQVQLDYSATPEGKVKAEVHSAFMKAWFKSEEGIAQAKNCSERMKADAKTEEGRAKNAGAQAKRNEWYKTSEGIAFREAQSERAKLVIEKRKASIPVRRCDVCDYTPPNNSKPKLDRHCKSQRHLDRLKTASGNIIEHV